MGRASLWFAHPDTIIAIINKIVRFISVFIERSLCAAVRFAAKFDSARDTGRTFVTNSTRVQALKYCPRTKRTVENCRTPTLRFSKAVDFAIPFFLRQLFAWPAPLQIVLKNDAKCSFFKLRRNLLSQRFQKRRIVPGYFGFVHKRLLRVSYTGDVVICSCRLSLAVALEKTH